MKRHGWPFVLLAACIASAITSCKKDRPPPPAPAPAEPVVADASSSFNPTSGGLERLDCTGIAPIEEAGTACAAGSRPTDALVHASERLDALFGMHRPPAPEWWAPARAALDAAKDVDPKAMSIAERVSVQNAALHVAVTAKDELARDALKLVERLAFTPAERDAALAQASGLTAWLGPASERTERTKTAPFLHEQAAHHTRFSAS